MHLIHCGGIMRADPEVQERLGRATHVAVERGFYRPQDGLPPDSLADQGTSHMTADAINMLAKPFDEEA